VVERGNIEKGCTLGFALFGVPILSFAKALTAYLFPSVFASTR